MSKCFSSASAGTEFELLSLRRHVQELQQRRLRGHRVRAPLVAAYDAMCKYFSTICVGIVFVHLRPAARGAMCKCLSSTSGGTVLEPL